MHRQNSSRSNIVAHYLSSIYSHTSRSRAFTSPRRPWTWVDRCVHVFYSVCSLAYHPSLDPPVSIGPDISLPRHLPCSPPRQINMCCIYQVCCFYMHLIKHWFFLTPMLTNLSTLTNVFYELINVNLCADLSILLSIFIWIIYFFNMVHIKNL
jgi:hypothetical protein